MRQDRIPYYLRMALMTAERSTCSRAKVGAVLTNHHRVVGTGYNGGPKGTIHCIAADIVTDGCGCITDEQGRCAISIHAEVNAILSREGQSNPTDSLIMYCTHQPCRHCYRIMKQYGVEVIYYINPYPDVVRDKLSREWKLPMNEVFINVHNEA